MPAISRSTFEEAIASTIEPHERTAILGALLTKAVGSRSLVVVVGGSAISIWTHGEHVSGDIDIIGLSARLAPVLKGWGFVPEVEEGRGT
jgi:hypothetical protein